VLIAQSGRQITRNRWRLDIVEAAIWGAVTGCALAILGTVVAHASVWLMLAAVIVGASAGVFLKRYLLARAARQRVVLMLEELPGLCELMAICLTAGEGFREALTRVTDRGSGPLVEELHGALSKFRIGIPVATALAEVSGRLQLAPLSRMVDHVISSIERGSPLAEVLRVQAADARAEAGRRLQERASAREVVMLLPLVFLILPITIAFAIFPGLLVIQTGL
jgi:tight adherence protein C